MVLARSPDDGAVRPGHTVPVGDLGTPEGAHGRHRSTGRSPWVRVLALAAVVVVAAGSAVAARTLAGGDGADPGGRSTGPLGPAATTAPAPQATGPVPSSSGAPMSSPPESASGSASTGGPASRRALPSATRTASPLAGLVVAVDPGHNGGNHLHPEIVNKQVRVVNGSKACDTTGTQTDRGYAEHAFTWDLALRLRAVLRAQGATVVLTRDDDTGVGPCITERAAVGNRTGADLAISLHADGASASGRGFHVIAPGSVGSNAAIVAPSKHLATAVRNAFEEGTGMPRSTYTGSGKALTIRTDLGGLNLSTVPKIFIECGNMRNATDAALLGSPSWRDRAARAIAAGLAGHIAPGR